MNDDYMQLKLAKENQTLTTSYTRRGFNLFKRPQFGVNSAVKIINEEIRKVVARNRMALASLMIY